MAKKNKFKRNKSDIPSNIFDGGGIITDMYTLDISGPKLSQSGLSSSYLTGMKYGNMGNTSNIGSNLMSGLGQAALGAGIGFLGNTGGNLIAGGKLSGIGNTIGSLGSTIGGAVMMANPLVGGAILGGTSLIKGAFNAIGGVKLNKERIALAENEINAVKNFNANASNFDDLSLLIMNAPVIAGFSLKDIGSNSLFNKGATKEYNRLNDMREFAEAWKDRSIANAATNLLQLLVDNLLLNYAAYGGLLDYDSSGAIDYDLANRQLGIESMKAMSLNRQYSLPNLGLNTFAEGGGIHIKPSKKGTFTAAAKKHGKGVQEFASLVLANKENYSPTMIKKAVFAKNFGGRKKAFGGDLLTNGTVFSNGTIQINAGGLHSTNPYEGVQMGVDPLGIPNLVEEGELIWNDYVFSNRIPVPDAVRNKYKLRGTKDMSFSDAAKKVLKASEERPNDPIAQDTLDINLSRLALEQEAIREKRNMKRLNRQYAKGGILGNKGNLFFTGGPYEYGLNPLNMENYSDLSSLYKLGSDYMNKRLYIIDNWNSDYVKNWIKNTYVPYVLNYNKSRGYKSDFTVNLDLFTKGTYDNLYGGMHKGVLDFTIPETNRKKLSPTMNIYTTRGRKGGDISINPEALDFYGYSIPLDIIETTKDSEGNTINYLQSLTNNNTKTSKSSKLDDVLPPLTSRWFDETVLRYAPVVGSAIGLGLTLFNKPDYSRADALALYAQNAGKVTPISYDPLGNYLTYRPNDVEYIANKMAALAAATRRGIMNTSGGNRAFALAGLAALDYSSLLALAEAIRQADESNFNRGVLVETFNRGTNLYNSEAALKAAMANQEARMKASQLGLSGYSTAMLMKDAIDAQRNTSINANLSSLFESLGNIGIDAANRRDRDFYINTVVPNLPIGEYARVYGKSKAKKEVKRRGYNDLEISNLFD